MSDLTKRRGKGELTVKDITSLHAEVRPKNAAPRDGNFCVVVVVNS